MPQPDPDRLASLQQRSARLNGLREHPSWDELRRLVEERRKLHFESLTKRLMAGAPVDQREIDRTAGFFRGMEHLLNYPDLAEKVLRRALEEFEQAERSEEGAA